VKLQGSAEVAAGDRIDSYLFLSTAHDGSSSVSIKFTDVRIVCANTLTYASEGNGDKLSVKHTQGVHAALKLISGLVDARQARFEASIDQYVQLAALDIDAQQLSTFVRVVLRDVDAADRNAVQAQVEEKPARGEERITDIFHNDPACTLRSIKGSWWSALNAVTSYVDHERGNDAQQRLYSSFMGQGATLKERALKTALSLSA
jgi:phage/plasmid-like protein (TIGR03299 family)